MGTLGRVLQRPAGLIAGTVYGTIVAMAVIASASTGMLAEPARLAAAVIVTSAVFWLAHVYAHALAESIRSERRISLPEVRALARRESPVVLAAAPPSSVLVLGAVGVLDEKTAIWSSLAVGVAVLGFLGIAVARLERLGPWGSAAVVGVNLGLGLTLVTLKAIVSH